MVSTSFQKIPNSTRKWWRLWMVGWVNFNVSQLSLPQEEVMPRKCYKDITKDLCWWKDSTINRWSSFYKDNKFLYQMSKRTPIWSSLCKILYSAPSTVHCTFLEWTNRNYKILMILSKHWFRMQWKWKKNMAAVVEPSSSSPQVVSYFLNLTSTYNKKRDRVSTREWRVPQRQQEAKCGHKDTNKHQSRFYTIVGGKAFLNASVQLNDLKSCPRDVTVKFLLVFRVLQIFYCLSVFNVKPNTQRW